MGQTNLTAVNAKTISIAGVPIAGSGAATGPVTRFDTLNATAAVALNGVIKQGALPAGGVFTNFSDLDVATLLVAGVPFSGSGATVPDAPALSAAAGNAQNTLTWTDGSTGGSAITGHKLYRGTATGAETLLGTISSASPYIDTGLTNGTTYYYKMSAVNAVGESALSSEVSATPQAASAFIQPYNYHTYADGDSLTAQGASVAGTYGTTGTGISSVAGLGLDALAGVYSGHKLRLPVAFANAGGGAQTVQQILANPRTGTNTIDLTQVAAHEAGIVLLKLGMNNATLTGTSGLDAGSDTRAQVANAIAALTDPTVSWVPAGASSGSPLPLYQGRPKTVIIINEVPTGVTTTGTTNSGTVLTAPQAASLEGWATDLMKYSFDSGTASANPRVISIDVFHQLLQAGQGAGSQYLPKPGLLADGRHPAPTGADAIGKIVGARLAPILTPPAPFYETPTVATANNFLNPNPTMATGAGAGAFLSGFTLTSPLLPSGTTVASLGTYAGTSGTIVLSNAPTASGAATLTTTAGNFYNVTVVSGNVNATVTSNGSGSVALAAGAPISGVILPASFSCNGSNGTGLNADFSLNVVDATVGNELVVRITGTATAGTTWTLSFNQLSTSAKRATVDLSTALVRCTVQLKLQIASGSIYSVGPKVTMDSAASASATQANGTGPLVGSSIPYGNNAAYPLYLKNTGGGDVSDTVYKPYTTPTISLAGNGLAAGTPAGYLQTALGIAGMSNQATDVTLSIRQWGVAVVTD